jgi:hypothetical protein
MLLARNGHTSTPSLVRTPQCESDGSMNMSNASKSGRQPSAWTLAATESEHPSSTTTRHSAHNEYALIHPVPSGADVARRLSVMARRRRACRPAHHARRSIPQEGQAPALGPRRSPNSPCGATRQAGTVNPRRSAAFAEVRRCRQGNKPFCLGRVVICRPHGEMNPPCPRRTALTSNSSPAPGSMITSPASWP